MIFINNIINTKVIDFLIAFSVSFFVISLTITEKKLTIFLQK